MSITINTTMNTTLKGTAAVIAALVVTAGLFAGIASAKSDKDKKGGAHPSSAVSVRIGENGEVSVKNAAVTGISGTTISATSSWGATSLAWIIQTDASLKVRGKGQGPIRIADIGVGDRIDFDGMLVSAGGSLTVKASAVTDRSLEERLPAKTTFEGTLKAIASTTAPTTLTVLIDGTSRTVNVAADTSILGRLWAKTTLSRFALGDTIRIYGAMNASSTIDATVIRDTDIWF